MYPFADVPVVQMSLPTESPEQLFALGEALRPLRSEGVLVIGSGYMTHGVPYLTTANFAGVVPDWSLEFDNWVAGVLEDGRIDDLFDYATNAPALKHAHPTVGHFTPLFVALGAATDPEVPAKTVIDGFAAGLSKRSVQFD